MIVNNVTDMETVIDSKSFMVWFFLFPMNKQNAWMPEWAVAAVVFCVTTLYYAVWVYSTISQICKYLDIYCLSIKEKKAPTSPAAKGSPSKTGAAQESKDDAAAKSKSRAKAGSAAAASKKKAKSS